MRLRFSYYILRNIALFTFIPVKIYCFKGLWIKDNQYLNILLYFNKMLTILVRVKILTDALASVASIWIRAWFDSHRGQTCFSSLPGVDIHSE